MLEPGQNVLYGTEGICTIEAIETLRIGGKRSKYYVLRPVYRTRATIYVPTDNELLCSRMRPVLSEPEIESLLQSAAGESISWIDDPNERKQVFAQILSGGDRRRVLHLIRMLYVRRRELQKNGKHLRIADEQTLRDAEKLLNDEFAHVLHIPQQDVPDTSAAGWSGRPEAARPTTNQQEESSWKKSTRKRHLRPSARILRQ